MDDSPVFVTGLPRTGKTPLRIALGAHPRLSMTRKSRMWSSHYGRYGDLSSPEALDACLSAMLDDPSVARLLPDEWTIRDEFFQRSPTYANLFGVIHALYARSNGKPRWGEQMAGLEFFVDPILESWPNAVFIHMIDRPTNWIHAGSRLRPGRVGTELAAWLKSTRKALGNRRRHAGSYLILPLERLLSEPVPTLQQVGEFIDEEFNFGICDLLMKVLPEPDSSSLEGAARRFVEARTRSVLEELGYPASEAGGQQSGVWDLAAELWFGRVVETAKEAS